MSKLLRSLFLVIFLAGSLFAYPVQTAFALAIPAEINKSFTPLVINAGGISVLRVSVFNPNTTFPLTNVNWTDNLVGQQPGSSIAPPGLINNTCGGIVTAVPGTTDLKLEGGNVPAQVGATPGECYVEINVTSTTTGNQVNRIGARDLTASGVDNGFPVTIINTKQANATLNVVSVVPPSLSKGFAPNTISMGNVSTLSITINNNDNNSNLTGTSFTDTLPTDVILATPPFGGTPMANCGGSASLAATAGGNTIALTNATVTPGQNCVVTVNVTSAAQGVYVNTIPAGSAGPGSIRTDQGVTNANPASATLNVQPINVAKQFNPSSFQAGGTSTLTITIQNPTASNYTGVSLFDTLPTTPNTNLTYVPGSAATTCGPGTVSITANTTVNLTGGTIPPNSSCTITVNVTTPIGATAATYTNTIPPGRLRIASNPGATNVTPATANVSVYATGTGMAGSVKSFSIDPINAGQNTRLRIDLFAPADTNLTTFSMTDTLPPGVTITNVNSAGVPTLPAISGCGATPPRVLTANTGGISISLTGGTILAGARCRIDVWVTSSTTGTVTNTITPDNISNDQDRNPAGNLTDNLTVNNAENLSASKAFNPPTVSPNGLSVLTITLQNTYTSPLVNVAVTDPLPGSVTNGIVVAPVPDASTTCAGGIITAVPGSQTITMTGGTVPARVGAVPGICTITVTVQGKDNDAIGTNRTNIIPTTNVSGTVQSTGATINSNTEARATLRTEILTIEVVKGFNPILVYGPSYSTMSVQLINPNNAALTGIHFIDDMALQGAGMKLADPVMFDVGTCGGVLSGNPGDESFEFSGGSLAANSTCIVTLHVIMDVNANLDNLIPAGAVTTFNGVSNPKLTIASLTDLPSANVTKGFDPDTILPGGISTLTITIENTGNIPLVEMALKDELPAGTEVAGPLAPPPVNNCGGSLSAPFGAQIISLSNGTLAGLSNCTITVSVTSNTPGIYVNTIPIGNLTGTAGGLNFQNNRSVSATLNVIGSANTYSLGNRVWFDTDNSGTINGTETGVNAVNVELYSLDGSGNTTFVSTQTTANGGYYRFDNLPAGDYVVVIPASEFGPGSTLGGYWSSGTTISGAGVVGETAAPDADNDVDSDDNGVLQTGGTFPGAVVSSPVTLGPGTSEPTGETDLSPSGQGAADNLANMSVDFGFFRTEIGNLVFVDVNKDGMYDAGDTLLAGANVKLYSSNGTEINVGPDGILGTTDDAAGGVLTGAGGTYRFSGLPSGSYSVKVTPPLGFSSTADVNADTTTPNNNIDNNDNGVGVADGQVSSNVFSLIPGVTGASTIVTNGTGTTYNPSLDFGFVLSSNFSKHIAGTSEIFTTGTSVAIGEIVTYQVNVIIPSGTYTNATLVDTMEQGLAFVGCNVIDAPGLTTDIAGGFTSICDHPVVLPPMSADPADVDRRVTFNFGTLTNDSQADAVLSVTYDAIVLDIPANVDGVGLNNSAAWSSSAGNMGPAQTTVNILEPRLTIKKTANVTFIADGSPATFTLVISHTPASHTDAFDVLVSDVLPAGLDYVANSIDCTGGEQDPDAGSCVYDPLTRTIKATWSTFTLLPATDKGIIKFDVIGNSSIPANGSVTNVGNVEWSTLPGDKSTPHSFSIPPNPFATERRYDPLNPLNVYHASSSLTLTPVGGNNGGGGGKNKNPSTSGSGGFLIPVTGFAPNRVTVLDPASRTAYDSTNLTIKIPAIKVNTSIVGVQLKDGNWDVSWLQNKVGWLNGTAYPTWTGNSVLTAHSVYSNGKPGIFSNLKGLNSGDYIFVYNLGYRYTYKVVSNEFVQPNDITVLQHEDKAYLTLITCDTYDEMTGAYLRRISVRAELIDVREAK